MSETNTEEQTEDRTDDPGSPSLSAVDAARRGAEQLALLTGRPVDGVAAVRRADDGWLLTLDVVEVARVPRSTDVIGSYEVDLGGDGDLRSYERVRRYVRSRAGEDA